MNEELSNRLYELGKTGNEAQLLDSIGGGSTFGFIGLFIILSLIVMVVFYFTLDFIYEKFDLDDFERTFKSKKRRYDSLCKTLLNIEKEKDKFSVIEESYNDEDLIKLKNEKIEIENELNKFSYKKIIYVFSKFIKNIINFANSNLYATFIMTLAITCIVSLVLGAIIGLINEEISTSHYEEELSSVGWLKDITVEYPISNVSLIKEEDSSNTYYVIHYELGDTIAKESYEEDLKISEEGKSVLVKIDKSKLEETQKKLDEKGIKIDSSLIYYLNNDFSKVFVESKTIENMNNIYN